MTPRGSGTLGGRWAPPEHEEVPRRLAAPPALDNSMIKRPHQRLLLLLRCRCHRTLPSCRLALSPLPVSLCPKQLCEYLLPDVFLNGPKCQ